MGSDDLVIVASFAGRPEAELARSALEAAGIDSMIRADDGGSMRPAMAWAGVGFQVIVREWDAAEARVILEVPARRA